MKTVLSLIQQVMVNYLLAERGESIVNNDDHLTLTMADGKSYRVTVEEIDG